MPLTYDQRVELLAKARQAKKEKMLAGKAPPVNEDSETSSEDMEEPDNIPTKFPKSRTPNPRWLKKEEPPKRVKDDARLSKEEPVITDREPTPIPKKRAPRKTKEPVNTLDITEPRPIQEVMEEVVNNDVKYKPKPKATPKPKASKPISITKCPQGICLFDY